MINLYVQDYCHKCPNFVPNVSNNCLYSLNGEVWEHSISITCKMRDTCKSIYKIIENKLKEENKDDQV